MRISHGVSHAGDYCIGMGKVAFGLSFESNFVEMRADEEGRGEEGLESGRDRPDCQSIVIIMWVNCN